MAKSKARDGAGAPPDPDRLIRTAAGTYRTADDRFEVRQTDAGWFVVDTARTNEFGQELIHGPHAALKAARATLPELRSAQAHAPARRPKRAGAKRNSTAKRSRPPPPPPPSWIDAIPKPEAARVRRMIKAMEREGISDAEGLVRRDRDGLLPAIATRRVEHRLATLIDETPPRDRDVASDVVRRVADVLSAGGSADETLPGSALVETEPEADLPNRRIDLRR
ncbi:MAG: hypothetical protein ACR2K4_06160 [Candidatus Limnocylindria bacterium]